MTNEWRALKDESPEPSRPVEAVIDTRNPDGVLTHRRSWRTTGIGLLADRATHHQNMRWRYSDEPPTVGGVDLDAMNQAINDAVRAAVEESGCPVCSVADWTLATSVTVDAGGCGRIIRYAWKDGRVEWLAARFEGSFPSFAEAAEAAAGGAS